MYVAGDDRSAVRPRHRRWRQHGRGAGRWPARRRHRGRRPASPSARRWPIVGTNSPNFCRASRVGDDVRRARQRCWRSSRATSLPPLLPRQLPAPAGCCRSPPVCASPRSSGLAEPPTRRGGDSGDAEHAGARRRGCIGDQWRLGCHRRRPGLGRAHPRRRRPRGPRRRRRCSTPSPGSADRGRPTCSSSPSRSSMPAVDAGLPQELAAALTTQLLVGSAKLLAERGDPAALAGDGDVAERNDGGRARGVRRARPAPAFVEAVRAATQRSRELSAGQ